MPSTRRDASRTRAKTSGRRLSRLLPPSCTSSLYRAMRAAKSASSNCCISGSRALIRCTWGRRRRRYRSFLLPNIFLKRKPNMNAPLLHTDGPFAAPANYGSGLSGRQGAHTAVVSPENKSLCYAWQCKEEHLSGISAARAVPGGGWGAAASLLRRGIRGNTARSDFFGSGLF